MKIEVNNQRIMEITERTDGSDGIMVEIFDSNGYTEDVEFIHEGDLVMLYNYWRNCKSGLEDSDYIMSRAEEERRIYC